MKFEIYIDSVREFRWRLRAANGETIADSAEGYSDKSSCLHGINLIKQYAATAQVVDSTIPQRG